MGFCNAIVSLKFWRVLNIENQERKELIDQYPIMFPLLNAVYSFKVGILPWFNKSWSITAIWLCTISLSSFDYVQRGKYYSSVKN